MPTQQPDPDDDMLDAEAGPPDPYLHPVHLLVAATDCIAPPPTRAPVSIFALGQAMHDATAMAAAIAAAARLRKRGRFGAAVGFLPSRSPAPAVQREAGVVKVTGAAYPANRWTDEKAEAEQARRARQRPPKPTKGARTRGKKVRQWDGEGIDD
jgi:hypothetical protein